MLVSTLTVHENIYFAARFKMPQGTSASECTQRATDLVEGFGLAGNSGEAAKSAAYVKAGLSISICCRN